MGGADTLDQCVRVAGSERNAPEDAVPLAVCIAVHAPTHTHAPMQAHAPTHTRTPARPAGCADTPWGADTPDQCVRVACPLAPGDTLVIASDGLYDNLFDDEILQAGRRSIQYTRHIIIYIDIDMDMDIDIDITYHIIIYIDIDMDMDIDIDIIYVKYTCSTTTSSTTRSSSRGASI